MYYGYIFYDRKYRYTLYSKKRSQSYISNIRGVPFPELWGLVAMNNVNVHI